MADWGGLYLRQDLGASAAVAALAFAFFTGGMTVGRVFGDWLNGRMGPVALLRWGALLMGIPLAAMLLIGTQAAALAGLFAIGLGVSNGVPLMFSAAGRQPDTPPGPAIGAVSSLGSLGFLAGPPFIGVLADAVSLPWALATMILGAVVVFALARRAVGHTLPAAGAARRRCEPVAVRDLRRGHLRPRRRARRLRRADGAQLARVGRAPRPRRRGDPGRQPRPPGARGDRRARGAGAGRRGDRVARPRARRPTPTASSPTRARATCSPCRRGASRSPPRASAPLARARLAAAGPGRPRRAGHLRRGRERQAGAGPATCWRRSGSASIPRRASCSRTRPPASPPARAAGMTVWAVTTTHEAAALGEAQRVAAGLPEHLRRCPPPSPE